MKIRTLAAGTLAAGSLAAAATPAFGHAARVECQTGKLVLVADYLQLTPQLDVASATVTWSDGFRVRVAIPNPCAPPPPVATIPPPVAVTPPTPTEPAPIEPMPRVVPPPATHHPPVRVSTRVEVLRRVRCFTAANARRSYVVQRTVATWRQGGKVIRVRVSPPRRVAGAVCATLG